MQNSWIPIVRGKTVRQARVALGELYEEHVSRQGFFGTAAMLYHKNPIVDPIRVEGSMGVGIVPLAMLSSDDAEDVRGLPVKVLFNDEMSVYVSRRRQSMPFLYRNIDADELHFIHEGSGVFATEYGPIAFEVGDLILLPKGTTFRILIDTPISSLIVESIDAVRFTEHQQVGRHAPFDPTVLTIPDVVDYDWPRQDEWELVLKHGDELTRAYFAALPFDVVGWKGDNFPLKLNLRDVRPITSERLHLAPSSWSIFEASGFMFVAFLPMGIVSDPEAEELPSRHRNVDSEEVVLIRYSSGAPVGILGHFPQGVTHGPDQEFRDQYEKTRGPGMVRMTDGVSVDSYRRLKRTPAYQAKMVSKMKRPVPASTD